MTIYLFTVSNSSLLLMPLSFLANCCVLWLNDTYYSKSEEVNRKCPARNAMVQLSTPYTDPECHSA